MTFSILTLFPEMFSGPFAYSIVKRAQTQGLVDIKIINIRDFATDRYRTVDDRPYGGGVGMILKVDVIDRALEYAKTAFSKKSSKTKPSKQKSILLEPTGKLYSQKQAKKYAQLDHLIIICGHYEGVDARVEQLVDEVVSIGDYILTGGEIPAMVMVDSTVRLIPQVLPKEIAIHDESFMDEKLSAPQYTRPQEYKGLRVPEVLLSGNHQEIENWRKEQKAKRTQARRAQRTTHG